jgi:putative membrane protein
VTSPPETPNSPEPSKHGIEKTKSGPRPPDIMADDRVLLAWQRSHMANERTFLAWSRTSVSLLAFGFVVEKFELFLSYVMKIGGAPSPMVHKEMAFLSLFCFLLAGLSVLVSGIRFLATRRHINRGEASYSVLPDILVVVSVMVIIVMVIILSLPRLSEMGLPTP